MKPRVLHWQSPNLSRMRNQKNALNVSPNTPLCTSARYIGRSGETLGMFVGSICLKLGICSCHALPGCRELLKPQASGRTIWARKHQYSRAATSCYLLASYLLYFSTCSFCSERIASAPATSSRFWERGSKKITYCFTTAGGCRCGPAIRAARPSTVQRPST